jgi:hypothetical protein
MGIQLKIKNEELKMGRPISITPFLMDFSLGFMLRN